MDRSLKMSAFQSHSAKLYSTSLSVTLYMFYHHDFFAQAVQSGFHLESKMFSEKLNNSKKKV